MNQQPIKESDWKIYRKRVVDWRERYLEGKNGEIVKILSDEAKTPTDRFWDALDEMKKQAKILQKCLDQHSRSNAKWSMFLMLGHGLIEDADLDEFSEELREQVLGMAGSSRRAAEVVGEDAEED